MKVDPHDIRFHCSGRSYYRVLINIASKLLELRVTQRHLDAIPRLVNGSWALLRRTLGLNRSHIRATRGLHEGQPTSIFNHIHTPQHETFHVNYLPPSIHWKNRPACSEWQVPTAEVRSVTVLCILTSKETWPTGNSPRTTLIHNLDDDSLLHVFYLLRPFLLGEDEDDNVRFWGGRKSWTHGRWWYRLAHVCQRWRAIILGSASHLDLSLVCTYGTHVADMLAHSPHLPLVVDHYYTPKGHDITINDEERITLALKKRDRVRRVRLRMSATCLQKFIATMDEEYQILEFLVIELPIEDNSTILILPETLQAPHLRHLRLIGFALPIRSQLLTTAVGLAALSLHMVHPSTYFHLNTLIQCISLIPQLETLEIYFKLSIPNHGVERQLAHTPIIVTLPNLRYFWFHGVSTYLDALVHRIATPRLEKFQFQFFNQLTFSVPRLQQFVNATESLRFDSAIFTFSDRYVDAVVYLHGETEIYTIGMIVFCWHLDWQVSSMAQISNSLGQIFSAVERLDLQRKEHRRSSKEHNEVDRSEWRKLLRPFRNVKTLHIGDKLVKDLSRCLQLEDGELPLELLPELQELRCPRRDDTGDTFTSFINARQNAGRPITLVRR